MFCPPVPESAVEFDPTLGRLLAPWIAGRTPLFRRDLTDGDGVMRRYAIYDLSLDLPTGQKPWYAQPWTAAAVEGLTR
jgi:hypothetical protein